MPSTVIEPTAKIVTGKIAPSSQWGAVNEVVATSIAAGFALLTCRFTLVGLPYNLRSLPTLAVVGYYDLLFVGLLCVLTLLLILMVGARAAVWLARAHLGVLAISLILGLTNIKTVWNLGQPLTYSWLSYSDFLTGLDAHSAIKSELSLGAMGYGLAVISLFASLRYFLIRALALLSGVSRFRGLPVFTILIAGGFYFPVGGASCAYQMGFNEN